MSRLWLSIGVAVVAWMSFGPVAGAAELPTGTFTASLQKDWSIKFEGAGKFTVIRGGKAVVEGTYKATETELSLTDEKGPFAAKEDAAKTGKYKWNLDGGKLKFTLVEDKSKGRELLLTSNEWAEAK
jgi:hypothetical protein